MAQYAAILWTLLLIFIIGILPLYITVKLLGGRASLVRVLIIKVAAVLLAVFLSIALGITGPLFIMLALIILYRFAFRMGIIRAFLAWLLEGVVMIGLIYAFGALDIIPLKFSALTDAFMHLVNSVRFF